MYGLTSERGGAHRKPTRFLASHEELLVDLDRKCDGSHQHDLVMGGPSVTAWTGRYTMELAKSIVKGLLKIFRCLRNHNRHPPMPAARAPCPQPDSDRWLCVPRRPTVQTNFKGRELTEVI